MRYSHWLSPWIDIQTTPIQHGVSWHREVPVVFSSQYSIGSRNSLRGDRTLEADGKYAEHTTSSFWSLPSLTFICTTNPAPPWQCLPFMNIAACDLIPFNVDLLTVHTVYVSHLHLEKSGFLYEAMEFLVISYMPGGTWLGWNPELSFIFNKLGGIWTSWYPELIWESSSIRTSWNTYAKRNFLSILISLVASE